MGALLVNEIKTLDGGRLMFRQENSDLNQNYKEGLIFPITQILVHKTWYLIYDSIFCGGGREE